MSKLGNISYLFGKQFNIAIANTYSYILLNGSNLPSNCIIISSPTDSNGNDTGTYSLIATDYEGNSVRLTYCIDVSNGFKNTDDTVYLGIDNYTIKDDKTLYVNLSYLVDNKSIEVNSSNKLGINTSNLQKADNNNFGVLSVDGKTISSDNGILFVQTNNLDYSDTSTNTKGILTSISDKINIDNGIISINTENLSKCTNIEFGIAKGDEYTILSEENGLSINQDNLDKVSVDSFGLISNDGINVNSNNGELSVNTSNLTKASDKDKGIIKIDGNTIKVDENERITIDGYSKINEDINLLSNSLDEYINSLNEIEEEIITQIK